MKRLLCLLSLIVFSSAVSYGQDIRGTGRPLAFTHVTLIDATGSPAQPDMTVVVTGNTITAIGKANAVTVPANAVVTNATGKFMIPGLWDMHQHTFTNKNVMSPEYVMWMDIINGITGVRDMGDHLTWTDNDGRPDDPWWDNFIWRRNIAAGTVIGPRLVMAGPLLEGAPARRKGWIEIFNGPGGRKAVDFLKDWGVDFVKVHNDLSRESYFAIADEAKKDGITYAGHLTNRVSASEASDAGQKSLEHLQGILVACSTQEQEMMAALQEEGGEPALLHHAKPILATYSDDKCRALFAKFVQNDTYICPTLIRERTEARDANDPHLAYLSKPLRDDAVRGAEHFKADPELKPLHAQHYLVVKEMQQAGVKLLVGTDASLYGWDTHREMSEMVAAGLTPMQVLQAATRTPAEFLGKLDTMGTVEKGKIADLVVLDANPLDSIDNAEKVNTVVLNGHLLDRKVLDDMAAQVKAGANSTPKQGAGYGDLAPTMQ